MSNSALTNAENIGIRIAKQQAQANKHLRDKAIIDHYSAKRKPPKFEKQFHVGDIAKFYQK